MKVVDHLERVLVRLYHASAGMQRWYWAEILKGLALIDDHRGPKTIKPNQVTLCLSTLVIVCMIVRSCLIIAFLDRLDREQRLLLFTEQFPATVRKHIEILVLAWSIFYLAIVLGLDFGRTTGEQWACLEILIIGGEHKETLTQQEWTQFEKFRTRLVQLVGVFVSNLAIITALILVLLSMHSGTFALSPLLTTAYHVFIILWVSVVCYPIYPLMSVLILWARHHAMLQRASQRWMQRIARGKPTRTWQLYHWFVFYNRLSVDLARLDHGYFRSYLSILLCVFWVLLVYMPYVIFIKQIQLPGGPYLFLMPLAGNTVSMIATLLVCSRIPRRHHILRHQLDHLHVHRPKSAHSVLSRSLLLSFSLEHFRLRRTGFSLWNGVHVLTSVLPTFFFYASQLFLLIFNI